MALPPQPLRPLLDCTLAMLALINPVSKLFVVSTLAPGIKAKQVRELAVRSSLAALVILAVFTLIGNPLLTHLFQVQVYSFKIAGGMVLLYRGFLALDRGQFYEIKQQKKLAEMSIVPLASPLIAGPGAIAGSVSFPARYGITLTLLAIVAALGINLVVMLFARDLTSKLNRHNIMGALIRITGLIVATIGIQMVLDGVTDYITTA